MAPQRTGPAGPFPASFGIDDALAFIASEPAFWIGARPPTAVKCAKSSSPAVRIDTLEGLEALYGSLGEASTAKVADRVTPEYRALIAASPFAALATVGPEGLDCSPRGDLPGFVRVHDERTLMLPDRRGNNRVDSLRNVVRDPRVALMFLIPGWGNALRVNGRAHLDADGGLLASFAVEGTTPRSVVVVEVGEVYFQCARAVIRAGLWDPARHADPRGLPTPGRILAALSADRVGGEGYDRAWAGRAAPRRGDDVVSGGRADPCPSSSASLRGTPPPLHLSRAGCGPLLPPGSRASAWTPASSATRPAWRGWTNACWPTSASHGRTWHAVRSGGGGAAGASAPGVDGGIAAPRPPWTHRSLVPAQPSTSSPGEITKPAFGA